MTQYCTKPVFVKIVGDIAHTLHTTGDHHLVFTQSDLGSGNHHSFHTRRTNFIHSCSGRPVGESSFQGRLSCRSLSATSRKYIPHNDLLHMIRRDTALFDPSKNGSSAELGRSESGQ